jgi:Cytochrome C oxidase, cbb3-type, subunit III
MPRRPIDSLTILLVLLVIAAARTAVASGRSGEDIFATTCASCHGSDGRGASPSQSGLSVRPLDFTDCRRTNREPDHDWHAVIAEGGPARGFHRMMPAFGEVLPEGEQAAVLDYTRGFCADKAFPRGDLNFPRPMFTEKAFVEDEFVVSTAVATKSPRNVDSKLVYEQRFLHRWQLEVMVPFGVARGADGSREAGIGDIAAGAKTVLIASRDTGTILSVAGEAAFPTGNKDNGFGKGVVVFEPFLSFGQILPWDFFLHLQTGAEIPAKDTSGVETEGFLRTALGRSLVWGKFGRSFTPMVEAVAFRELKGGAPTSLDLVPQMQISLSRRQHVLASLGASFPTMNREGRSPQAMAYLLWDWFDGGLFEAW